MATTTTNLTPIKKRPKADTRPSPYPILLGSDRRSRKRKSLTWQTDEKMRQIHYFEYIADERINVTRINSSENQQNDANATTNVDGGSSQNANNRLPIAPGSKISNASVDPIKRVFNGKVESEKVFEYSPWRTPVLIDFVPELPSPGWASVERTAQAERESCVLGAIDLPGQPSTLDEPDQIPKSGSSNGTIGTAISEQNAKEEVNNVKIIPLDNAEGMYTEYQDMYNSELVNGVKLTTDNPQPVVQNLVPPFQNQSHIVPNQQLVYAQMQLQFPFQIQQQQPQQDSVQRFQQPIMPFTNQQQLQVQLQQQPNSFVEQQPGLTGPVMPWLSYPFDQVSENSHAHLFRRSTT